MTACFRTCLLFRVFLPLWIKIRAGMTLGGRLVRLLDSVSILHMFGRSGGVVPKVGHV